MRRRLLALMVVSGMAGEDHGGTDSCKRRKGGAGIHRGPKSRGIGGIQGGERGRKGLWLYHPGAGHLVSEKRGRIPDGRGEGRQQSGGAEF